MESLNENININIFESDEESDNSLPDLENEEDSNEESSQDIFEIENTNKYKKENYNIKDIINKLMKSNLLLNVINCPTCNKVMNLTENKNYKDGYDWRCAKNGTNKHDDKCNIRYKSIFANTKTDIRILFFIIFENFIFNLPLNSVYKNCKEFSKDIEIENISRNYLAKIYNIFRIQIKKKMHKIWSTNKMGTEPCNDGKSKIEIDESKFITYNNRVRWMFGLVDRSQYDIRIFYIDDNR